MVIIAAFAIVAANREDDGPDALLTDPGAVITQPTIAPNADVEGDPLPIVDLGDRDGNSVSTASFLGRPLVINFWFSTCAPCAKELPDFATVHGERGDDVRFIGVNTNDSVEAMERFAGERGVQYELYLDDFAELTDAIRAINFPVTIFVTSEGRIVEQTGVLDVDELRAEIDQLLELEA